MTALKGIIPRMERLYRDTESENSKADIERYMVAKPCPVCEGKRLKPEALAVTVGGKNIMEVTGMSGQSVWTGLMHVSAKRPEARF